MNKFEALILTGKLEVLLANKKEILGEIESMQKYLAIDDFINLAISLGKLSELLKSSCEDIRNHIEKIIKYCVTANIIIENIAIEDLNFSVRTYSALKRANCYTVADILKRPVNDLIKIRNLGIDSAREIADKMKELGFDEWAEKLTD